LTTGVILSDNFSGCSINLLGIKYFEYRSVDLLQNCSKSGELSALGNNTSKFRENNKLSKGEK